MNSSISSRIHTLFTTSLVLVPLIWLRPLQEPYLLPRNALLTLLALLLVAFFLRWLGEQESFSITLGREPLLFAMVVVALLLSCIWSAHPLHALAQALPFLAAFIFFIVYLVFYSREDPLRRRTLHLLHMLLVAAALQALVALLQFLGLDYNIFDRNSAGWRVFGTMGDPRLVAEFLVPVFFLNLNLLQNAERPRLRRLYRFCLVLIVLGLFATFNRSGLLLLVAGLFVYAFIHARRQGTALRLLLKDVVRREWGLLAILVAALVLILLLFPLVKMDEALINHLTAQSFLQGRLFVWKNSIAALWHSLPVGSGSGGFPLAFAAEAERHFTGGSLAFLENARAVPHAFNDVLHFFIELGVLALPLLLLLVRLIRRSLHRLQTENMSIGICCAFLVLTAGSLFNAPLHNPAVLILFALLATLVYTHRELPDRYRVTVRFHPLSRRAWYLIVPLLLLLAHIPLRMLLSSFLAKRGALLEQRGNPHAADGFYAAATAWYTYQPRAAVGHAARLRGEGRAREAAALAAAACAAQPSQTAFQELALAARSLGDREGYLAAMRRRALVFRNNIPCGADYVRALMEENHYQAVLRETAHLNRVAGQRGRFPTTWLRHINTANGAALGARLSLSGTPDHYCRARHYRALARKGRQLYIATEGQGVLRYDVEDGKFTALPSPDFAFTYTVRKVGEKIWVGSERGLFELQEKSGRWRRIEVPGWRAPCISSILCHGDQVWLTSPTALFHFDRTRVRWRTIHTLANHPLKGLRCGTAYSNTLFFGGYGNLVTIEPGGKAEYHTIENPWWYSPTNRLPSIQAVHPFGHGLIGLATDQGLLTYFRKGRSVVKVDYPNRNIIDINMDRGKIILLTERNRILVRDLRGFFTQINRDALSRASVAFTERFIRIRYSQMLPSVSSNLAAARLFLYNDERYRNVFFAASPEGLFFQAGEYGAEKTLRPTAEGPGPLVLDVADDGEDLYIADSKVLWRFDGKEFRRLEDTDASFVAFCESKPLSYAAGRSIYRIRPGAAVARIETLPAEIRACAGRGDWLAVAWGGGRLRLFREGRAVGNLAFDTAIRHLALGPTRLYVALADQGIRVLDLPQQEKTGTWADRAITRTIGPLYGLPDGRVTGLAFRFGKLWIGTAAAGCVLYDPANGSLEREERFPRQGRQPVTGFRYVSGVGMFFCRGNRLVLARTSLTHSLELGAARIWPVFLSRATVHRDQLVVAGAGGIYVFPRFSRAVRPFLAYLEGE